MQDGTFVMSHRSLCFKTTASASGAGPVGVRRVRLQAEQRLKPNRGSCCRCTENASRSTRVLGRVSHKSGRVQNNATIESGMKIVDEMFAVGKPDSRETSTLKIV